MKLFAYYPTWAVYTMPPSNLKFPAGIDMNYIHFSSHVSSVSPYFGPSVPGHSDIADLSNSQSAFISACHSGGGKALLSITAQGGDGDVLSAIANNATQRRTFVLAVSAYCKSKGYDGVDIDWETGLSSGGVRLLLQEFRAEFNLWTTPGILVMATLPDPFIYPGAWDFYDVAAMNQYLDAYFGMNYVLNTAERDWGSLGNANSVWRCMFDCPLDRPTGAPWNSYVGGYWAADLKTNSITKWVANGADILKVGIGLWNGGSTMLNSSSTSRPGSSIIYGTAGYVTYAQCLAASNKTYDIETDSFWGIVNGLYCSWIDPQGAYNRVKWARSVGAKVFMLYDVYTGFTAGQQPHFDKMVEAMLEGAVSLPSGIATVSPSSLPIGGGNVNVAIVSQNATSATVNGQPASPNGTIVIPVTQTTTFTIILSGPGGSTTLPQSTVSVALPVNTTKKIMMVGDSITELDWQGGYRSQLYRLLLLGGYSFDFAGRNILYHDDTNLGFIFPPAYWKHEGYSNATIDIAGSTYVWKDNILAALTAGNPDVVCVMLGTNDVFSTIRTATQVRDAMSAFLDSIWAFNPNIKIVLSTMPRVFGYSTALPIIRSANNLFPAMVAAKVSAGRSITLVDNYAALTVSGDFVDGVHPSVGGYLKMANAWLPAVVSSLSSSTPLPFGTVTISPSTLPSGGGNVSITIASQNATSATINGSAAPANGTVVIPITSTTTFTVVLTGPGGSTTLSPTTVSVAAQIPAPTGTITATPTTLPFGGGNVVFTMASQNATSASLNGVPVPVNGNYTVGITTTGQYILILTGAGGSVTLTAITVTVSPQNCQAEYQRGLTEGYGTGFAAGRADAALLSGIAQITDQNGRSYAFNISLRT